VTDEKPFVTDKKPFVTDWISMLSPFDGPCARRHKNRPDTVVGRLHYSLSLTLSAHFR
jgi:hypothetical protein